VISENLEVGKDYYHKLAGATDPEKESSGQISLFGLETLMTILGRK